MKKRNITWVMVVLLCLLIGVTYGQEVPEKDRSYKPLTLKLSDDGGKYIRFIIWNQFWLQTNNLSDSDSDLRINPRIRRARMLAFAQVSDRFLILSHFGMNSEFTSGMHPLGESTNVSLFFHDIWGEYKLNDNLYMGMGVHYWNGLSRLTSQSTLNFMTLDAPIFNWAQLGLSDQFARHLGVYAKGNIGKFNYRVSLNDGLLNTLESSRDLQQGQAIYAGRAAALAEGRDENRFVAQGYFHVNLKDKESTKLPFFVGTYLGKKTVMNVGAGFFYHKGGTASLDNAGNTQFHDVSHFAVDAFYDAPIGANGAGINALLAYYNYDFGPNYVKAAANPGNMIATGSVLYAQLGYLLPGEGALNRFMPYVTYASGSADAFDDSSNITKLGMNYFMNGHNSKLTLEYDMRNTANATGTADASSLTLQMHIFL